jgi:hypothetical protein
MGREVRKVPANWQHPKGSNGKFIPLYGRSFIKALAEWEKGYQKWQEGLRENFTNDGMQWVPKKDDELNMSYEKWSGPRPEKDDYMPDWEDSERTHIQMYENTSEGTPISPVMDTPENLARWLVDNNASAFGNMTATYGQWLGTIKAGFAVSMIMTENVLMSGVEYNDF